MLYLHRNIEEKRLEVGAILRKLCELKGANIIEAEVCS